MKAMRPRSRRMAMISTHCASLMSAPVRVVAAGVRTTIDPAGRVFSRLHAIEVDPRVAAS